MKNCVVKLSIFCLLKTCYLDSHGLNRLLLPHIAKNLAFVMYVESCGKLCRKNSDTNVLKQRLFGLPFA